MRRWSDAIGRGLCLAALVAVGLVTGCASSAHDVPFTLGTPHRDLTYCGSQRLDLYIPRDTGQTLPVALYVHGGGMTAGDKSNLSPAFLGALTAGGYAVASIDYRLAPQSRFPAQIEDVKCAIRYLRARAPEYGLDRNAIFAFGTSVGGQLVALAALTGSPSPWDVGDYLGEPSNLAAVADIFGPANLTESASGFSASGIRDAFGRNDQQDLISASPTHYVAPGSPPVLLIQGVEDTKVLESQSIELYTDLKAAGDRTQLLLVQHMSHMFAQVGRAPIDPSLGQIAKDIVSFFDEVRGS
jgi:acetyl esterase/lipase